MPGAQLPEGFAEVLARSPLPEGVTLAYGTAGFRTVGSRIPPVAARMGPLIYLKAMLTRAEHVPRTPNHHRMGVMITASHNPHEDNGLKVVDLDGGMLSIAWEPHAAKLANANDAAAYVAALDEIAEAMPAAKPFIDAGFKPALTPEEFTVVVGCDTRITSPAVVAALKESLSACGLASTDLGQCTTPVVHHHVFYGAKAAAWDATVATVFAQLITTTCEWKPGQSKRRVVVDCANGVGAVGFEQVLKRLSDHFPQIAAQYEFSLQNTDTARPELLNGLCGADYSQKTKKPAETVHAATTAAFAAADGQEASLGVYAVDGDADRVVAFDCVTEDGSAIRPAGEGSLLDGDRIIVLIAMTLTAISKPLAGIVDFSTGVVQTAYANGGSMRYVAEQLKLPSVIAATGVKHVHHAAAASDVGIYYEANGHGTMLIDENSRHPIAEHTETRLRTKLQTLATDAAATEQVRAAAMELLRFGTLLSPSCGDGIANVLVVEYCLRRLGGLSFKQWLALYADLPSQQVKVSVPTPSMVKTIPNETKTTAPDGMQEEIDSAIAAVGGPLGRSFVRPSGTEPVVRVYAEAATPAECEALTEAVIAIVKKHLA